MLVVLLASVLLVTACGSDRSTSNSTPATESTTPLANLGGCIDANAATLLRHEGGGIVANVAIMGAGDVGVVITYETFRDVCTWLPLTDRLVDAGYRVLLYDQVSGTGTDYVREMAGLMRTKGVKEIVLVGGRGVAKNRSRRLR